MSNTELLIGMVLIELVVIIGLVLVGVLVLAGRRRRRDREAAEHVAKRVRAEESGRESELRDLLGERFGYEGDELETKAQELLAAERQFYERFLDLYLNRDPEAARRIQDYLHDVLGAYARIEPPEPAAAQTESADEGASPRAAPPPTMEGRDPYEEIQAYQETLNLVFAEYTAMFGINQDHNAQLSAREIRKRMESGQLAGSDEADEGDAT